MRIAFIQRGWFESIGLMSIAASAPALGHQAQAFIGTAEPDIAGAILRFRPDLACFTCTTGEHLWAASLAREIKKRARVFTLFGGAHPTFFPDLIAEEGVDGICRGEGEGALRDLVLAREKGTEVGGIGNLWIKTGAEVIRNDPRPLIADLDSLPFPAREIYNRYPALQESRTKHFVVSRGCPFQCSYCYNHLWKQLYAGKGQVLRFKSAEYAVQEIEETRRLYPLSTVYFEDDVFISRPPWLKEFLGKYRKRIGLPFTCKVQANLVTEEAAAELAEAGCFSVSLGIETGDEELRRKVLNKHISDEQIRKTARILKERGIRILTLNMMGLPGETIGQAWKTIRLNAGIRADYPWCSLLQPYPNTEIERMAVEGGLLNRSGHREFNPVFFKDSPLSGPEIPKLVRLQKYFYPAVRFPRLQPLIRLLLRLPFRFLDHLVFLVSFADNHRRSNRLSLREIIRFGWRNRRLYL